MYNNNGEPTTVKEAAIKFDIFIRDGGVPSSMFFVLILLIWVNAHSLHVLFGDGVINWIASVIGAIGFSVATTSVIRKPVSAWMKYIFPLFDTILIFIGLYSLSDGSWLQLIMISLFAVFSGAILVGLGTINFNENVKEGEESELKKVISELREELKVTLASLSDRESELIKVQDELKVTLATLSDRESELKGLLEQDSDFESDIQYLKGVNVSLESELTKLRTENIDRELLESDLDKLKSELAKKTKLLELTQFELSELDKYKTGYLKAEASRIRKKKEGNWTEEEREIVEEVEKWVIGH